MHQQSLITYVSLCFLFMNSFSLSSGNDKSVYNRAIDGLTIIFREEPKVCAKAINRFRDEIMTVLARHDLASTVTVASIFRFAFIRHLAEHQVAITSGLTEQNTASVRYHIVRVFSPELRPWEEFVESVGLFTGQDPDDSIVEEAFKKVRQKTEPSYIKNADHLRRQFDAMVAYNTLPPLKNSK